MMKNNFSFRSQDIQISVLTFWSCKNKKKKKKKKKPKNPGLIRNIRLISKFMMSQPG